MASGACDVDAHGLAHVTHDLYRAAHLAVIATQGHADLTVGVARVGARPVPLQGLLLPRDASSIPWTQAPDCAILRSCRPRCRGATRLESRMDAMDAMGKARQSTQSSANGGALVEALVRSRTDELSDLVSHLQRSHEDQNRNLARELHDELGSLLTATKLDVTFIRTRCTKAAPELVAKCDRIASMIDQAAVLMRRMIDQLRPSTLDMLGLGPALRELVDNFATETGIATAVDIDDTKPTGAEPSLVIYRVIEASLAHIRDHAHAANIRIAVAQLPASITLRITDDGRGSDGAAPGTIVGVELASIRQRIAAAGGTVSFVATPGRGTVIEAAFPL